MEGIFILLGLVVGIIAAVAMFVYARRSRRPPGEIRPEGPGSPRVR
jgi:hypothetical protein